MSKKRLIILGMLGLALILFYPYQSEAIPEWTLRVVDETGNPVPNQRVIQRWRNYSISFSSDPEIDEKITDENGEVKFSAKSYRAAFSWRIFSNFWYKIMVFNPHRSFGVSGSVSVPCKSNSKTVSVIVYYKENSELPNTIIVTPDCNLDNW